MVELIAWSSGRLIPIQKVSDPVFSRKMVGDGLAIIPESSAIVAPCAGIVHLMPGLFHALSIETQDNTILIHAGINSVELGSEAAKLHVVEGQCIHPGDKIMDLNLELMAKKGFETDVIMVANTGEVQVVTSWQSPYVLAGKTQVGRVL